MEIFNTYLTGPDRETIEKEFDLILDRVKGTDRYEPYLKIREIIKENKVNLTDSQLHDLDQAIGLIMDGYLIMSIYPRLQRIRRNILSEILRRIDSEDIKGYSSIYLWDKLGGLIDEAWHSYDDCGKRNGLLEKANKVWSELNSRGIKL